MMTEVFEGRWEDLAGRKDLRGRMVRVIVLDETGRLHDDPWLKSLHAWADSHQPVGNSVDDSRESIYSGTVNDPR